MPGFGYVPVAGDTNRNGVYQDFAAFVRTYPTRWSILRVSRVHNLDAGLYKNFTLMEGKKLQLRFNAFNLMNHPRFSGPDTNPNNAGFGTVNPSQRNPARTVEFGARITF